LNGSRIIVSTEYITAIYNTDVKKSLPFVIEEHPASSFLERPANASMIMNKGKIKLLAADIINPLLA
jgi:hypothetical protein